MQIISRTAWGFTGWTTQPAQVPLSERTEYYIHYDGAAHINITGDQVPRRIDEEHKSNGWSGIGYHFVVDQAGNVFEGRGWDLQGAHCPNHNRSAIGVQIAIGGDQQPTAAALNAAIDLYEEACRRTGRTLSKHGHKDGFNTDCPGGVLYPWVQAGMPRPNNQEDDMPLTDDDIRRIWSYGLPDPDTPGRMVAAGDIVAYEDHRHNVLYARIVASQGAIAGLTNLVAKGANDLTAAQVQAAVDTSISKFLAGASVHIDVNSTNPTPKGN